MSGFFESLSTFFLVCILIIVVLQVFFRYVARIVVPWTEEGARYLCIWMVFLGGVAGIAKEAHIRITFILERVPETVRQLLGLLSYGVVFVFNVIVFLGSIDLVRLNWGQQAVTFPLSVGFLYLAVLISSGFILITLIFLTWRKLKTLFVPVKEGQD